MIFFVNETYHFAVRLKEVSEAEELAKSFASGHKICTAETEKELVDNMFLYIRFKKANRLYQFTLNDTEGKPLFIHINEAPLACSKFKDYFKSGSFKEIEVPSNVKVSSQMSFPDAARIEKKFTTVPFSIKNHVAKYGIADPQVKPVGEAETAEPIFERVNFDSSYENDELFDNIIKGATMLHDNYEKVVSQKQELSQFIKACDNETLDIIHHLELEYKWYDVITAYKTVLKITNLRRQRRKAKDKIEVINALEEGLSLECTKKVAELPERLENRIYRKRNNTRMFDYEKVFKKGK